LIEFVLNLTFFLAFPWNLEFGIFSAMLSDHAILACDPGGTKCHVILVSGDGRALGWGASEGAADGGRSESAFLTAARGALAGHKPQALTAISLHRFQKHALELGVPVQAAFSATEREATLALAGEECGLVILAGTGAFVSGKTRAGRELHLDGLGPMLGDTGGGYYIGLAGMRAAVKSEWHPRFQTSLLPRLYRHLGLQTMAELVAFSLKPKDRSVVAAFARIVDEAAVAGDAVAAQILRHAADEIAEILRVVIERLEMGGQGYTITGTGGVIRHSEIYWQRLTERAREIAPGMPLKRLEHPPVIGMALVGLRRLRHPDYARAAAALLASYPKVISKGALHDSNRLSR
jgi:N-acetylglucosamine kinase-like BadF-type ATPase